MDDFGIKYTNTDLLVTLQKLYKSSTDWDGQCYCGLTLGLLMTKGHVILPCLATLNMPFNDSPIHHLHNHNIPHMHGPNPTSTAQRSNMLNPWMNPPFLMLLTPNIYRRSLVHYYFASQPVAPLAAMRFSD